MPYNVALMNLSPPLYTRSFTTRTMKKYLIILSACILILTGCKQKAETSTAPTTENTTSAPIIHTTSNKGTTPVRDAVTIQEKSRESSNNAATDQSNENKLASRHKTVTEENLSETIAHARKLTKSEESKSRSRAEIAEEEMLKDLEKFK